MSEYVIVRGQSADNAVLLLEAAEKLDLPSHVVQTVGGGYRVPAEVADKAGLEVEQPEEIERAADEDPNVLSVNGFDLEQGKAKIGEVPKAEPAKKTPAKKTAAKKTTAKKAAAKKTTTKKES